jgi:gas vesicle protein
MTKVKMMLGIFGGLAIGTLIGVLLAPDKGERTRRKIRRKSEDLADAVNDKIDAKFEKLLDELNGRVKRTAIKKAGDQEELTA